MVSVLAAVAALYTHPLRASKTDEFKIERQDIFECAGEPKVTRQGGRVTVAFATKGFYGCTVATQDTEAGILRHVVCGAPGNNAHRPFQRNRRKQAVLKDEREMGKTE